MAARVSKGMARPRRLEDKIVSYMLGVMPLIEASGVVPRGEAFAGLQSSKTDSQDAMNAEDDPEVRMAALKNVVIELKFQTASAATDKRTAMILEVLAQAAGPECATMLLSRCAPYAAFIARNRHGSHVLQTILALVGEHITHPNYRSASNSNKGTKEEGDGWFEDKTGKSNDEGEDEDDHDEASLDPVKVLIAFWEGLIGTKEYNDEGEEVEADAQENGGVSPATIARNVVSISCDMCATHVLRSLLCILAGVPVVQERRGKHSKHGHSVQLAVSSATLRTQPRVKVDPNLKILWEKTCSILSGGDGEEGKATAVELQSMSCDSFGSATMVLLLELEATSNIVNRVSQNKPSFSSSQSRPGGAGSSEKGAGFKDVDDGPHADWSDQSKFGVLSDDTNDESEASSSSKISKSKKSKSKEVDTTTNGHGLKLIKKLLEWNSKERSVDVVYGLAGEASASHLLEAILRYSPDAFLNELVSRCLCGQFAEYAEHNVANYVVQTFLRVVRSPSLAASVIKDELLPAISSIAKNTGILWRLVNTVKRFQTISSSIDKKQKSSNGPVFDDSLGGLVCYHVLNIAVGFTDRVGADVWPPVTAAPSSTNRVVEAVYRLLSPTLPTSSSANQGEFGARLRLDVPGVNTLGNLLSISNSLSEDQQNTLFGIDASNKTEISKSFKHVKFTSNGSAGETTTKSNSVRSIVASAMCMLSSELISAIAVDSLSSRCLLQPLFELCQPLNGKKQTDAKVLTNIVHDLVSKTLRNKWCDIALHNVGQHTLRCAFTSGDLEVKEHIAQELSIHAKSKLLGSSGGRNSMRVVNMDSFMRNKEEWNKNMKHGESTKAMFQDILSDKPNNKRSLSKDTDKKQSTSNKGIKTERSSEFKNKKRKQDDKGGKEDSSSRNSKKVVNKASGGDTAAKRLVEESSTDQALIASLGFKSASSTSSDGTAAHEKKKLKREKKDKATGDGDDAASLSFLRGALSKEGESDSKKENKKKKAKV